MLWHDDASCAVTNCVNVAIVEQFPNFGSPVFINKVLNYIQNPRHELLIITEEAYYNDFTPAYVEMTACA